MNRSLPSPSKSLILVACVLICALIALLALNAAQQRQPSLVPTPFTSGVAARAVASTEPTRDREYLARQLVVQFERSATVAQRTAARKKIDAKLKRKLPGSGLELLSLPKGETVSRAAREIARADAVKFSEPNFKVAAARTPNDVRYPELWGMNNTGASGGVVDADIDAPEAWDTQTGSSSVRVGVLDTGVDYLHPDLDAQIWNNPGETGTDANGLDKRSNNVDDDNNGRRDDWRGFDFVSNDNNPMDDFGHGSHVAGTIDAEANNGIGVAGVSWGTKLVPLKVLDSTGYGSTYSIAAAIDYAGRLGLDVVNGSLGYQTSGAPSQAERDAIEAYPNTLFVFSAGNSGIDNDGATKAYPCSHPSANIVCVGASDRSDVRSVWTSGQSSNYGSTSVDLFAPGTDILSVKWAPDSATNPDYLVASGTSMASPHVAGIVALMKSAAPTATAADIKTALLRGVDAKSALSGLAVSGGRANAQKALVEIAAEVRANYFQLENGKLSLHGDQVATHAVTLEQGAGWTKISDSSALQLRGSGACSPLTQDNKSWQCNTAATSASLITGSGADTVTVIGGIATEISTGAGNDTITGGSGDDKIDGGLGGDIVQGGGGRDTFSYAAHPASVTVTLDGNKNDGIAGETDNLVSGIEVVVGSSYADTITGSTSSDELSGGPGNDVLNGGSGNDNLIGGTGNDTFNGDAGEDTADYSKYTSSVYVSINNSANDGGSGETDNVQTTVEDVVTGSGNDSIEGTNTANVLDGGAGSDWISYLYRPEDLSITLDNLPGDGATNENDNLLNFENVRGGDGADFIQGNSSDNTFRGGKKGDRFVGLGGTDWVWYDDHAGPVNVTLNDAVADGEAGEGDVLLSGIENVLGTYANDTLSGDDTANVLEARGGADRVYGNGGDDKFIDDDYLGTSDAGDLYDGGAGTDRFYPGADGANVSLDGVANDGPSAAGALRTDNVLANVEDVDGTGGVDTLIGSDSANRMYGGQGDDVIEGRGGDDTLDGNDDMDPWTCGVYSGNDVIRGELGNDRIIGGGVENGSTAPRIYDGGPGDDTIRVGAKPEIAGCRGFGLEGKPQVIGGSGRDLLDLSAESLVYGYNIIINNVADDGTEYDFDSVTPPLNITDDIEDVTGSEANDVIVGSSGPNTIRGGGGRDVIDGGGGADSLFGDAGDDFLRADDGTTPESLDCGDGGKDKVIDDNSDVRVNCEGTLTDPKRVSSDGTKVTYDLRQAGETSTGGYGTNGSTKMRFFHNSASSVDPGVFVAEGQCRLREIEEVSCAGGSTLEILGGSQRDYVYLYSYTGSARFFGNSGDDYFGGASGNDFFDGGPGNDTGSLADGDDNLLGGAGADSLYGGAGNDALRAADGEIDSLNCGTGADSAARDESDTGGTDCESPTIPEPNTTITSGPAEGSTITTPTVSVGFASNIPWATFECRLDSGSWQSCTSAWTTPQFGNGARTVAVRAVDQGVTDSTPATLNFTAAIDLIPPTLSVTSPTEGMVSTNRSTIQIKFAAGADSVRNTCQIDTMQLIDPCATNKLVHEIPNGARQLTVTAQDSYGNVASRTVNFTIITEPTIQLFSAGFSGLVSSTNLTTLGTTDWLKFTGPSTSSFVKKNVTTSRIGPVTTIGSGTLGTAAAGGATFSWSDGVPTTSGSDSVGLSTSGVGSGFKFEVPTNNQEALWVRLQVSATNAGFTVSGLPDGQTVPISYSLAGSASQVLRDVKFRYRPRTPTGKLTVSLTQDTSTGANSALGLHAIELYPEADTTDPITTLTTAPAEGATVPNPVSFAFTSNEPGNFQCALDWAAWNYCTSPTPSYTLGAGLHFFRVRALDAMGNWDETMEIRNFYVG